MVNLVLVHMVRLRSPDREGHRGTLVQAEFLSVLERPTDEPVHYRKEDGDPLCTHCGEPARIWMDDERHWERHPMRCI